MGINAILLVMGINGYKYHVSIKNTEDTLGILVFVCSIAVAKYVTMVAS